MWYVMAEVMLCHFEIRLSKVVTSVWNVLSFSWSLALEEASYHVRRPQISLRRGPHGKQLSSLANRHQESSQSQTPSRDSVGRAWGVCRDNELSRHYKY